MIDPDYLNQKRQELGLERYDTLQKIQAWLDERYPGQARAVSLNKGVLSVMCSSASLASNLRFEQQKILGICAPEASRLRITIGKKA